ncbi:MAG: DNA polymerase III subunit alpha [Anaerolineaceae bacterium]|nr:DNA polymerase III subunit alpha [Anaerolineaceae bacterium]
MFTHLHTHSYFSLLAGVVSPTQLAESAAKYGMRTIALTDHNRLSGAIEFYDACQAAGLQPILGLELSVRFPQMNATEGSPTPGSLVLLAMDMTGWGNLCRLSSELLGAVGNGSHSELGFENLALDTRGLICLTGGLNGELVRLLNQRRWQDASRFLFRLGEVFPNRLYVELQKTGPTDDDIILAQMDRAKRLNLPVVATDSVYYLSPEQIHLQKVLTAIRLNCTLEGVPPGALAPPGSGFTTPDEMAERFADHPEALAGTQEISSRCTLELPLGEHHYPEIQLPAGVTPIQILREKAYAGASTRFGEITPQIRTRLDHELDVISESGYTSLFLIMEEIIDFAIKADVPFSSRGSAASSLVAHTLGITSPDPIRLKLYFERFLNPARHSPPDIDTDLCSYRRKKVIEHVYQCYGSERVAMVSTINRFQPRSALREAAKTHGLSQAAIKKLAGHLPRRDWGPPQRTEDPGVSPFQDIEARFPEHQVIFQDAAALLNFPRHLSIHPGGVVIAPGPITELVPTQMASMGIVITQFDLEYVERIGLVKIDLLGTRGLSVLGDVADELRGTEPEPRQSRLAILDAIPDVDPETSELVRSGHTVGCFAIESPGMQHTLKEIQATSIDDIMVALALYRPGPMTGGLKDAFVNRHLGKEQIAHLHPALESLLAETYGVILYQEQVLQIVHELAGFSLSEADLLRRAMSHFDPGKRMQTLKENFIRGASELSGVPEAIGERIWELMAAFAGYGFPKAHAASYAQVAWKSAYCKTHHPAAFMAAVLANWGGYYRQSTYLLEARRLGLTLRGPHINHSRRQFSVTHTAGETALYMGLDQVRDLTRQTQKHILRQRPFHSLGDFMSRVKPRQKEAEYLVKAGALEGLGTIPGMLKQLKERVWQNGQLPLFPQDSAGKTEEDWTLEQKASVQVELLGVSMAAHPLELAVRQIETLGALTTLEAMSQVGRSVRVAGIRQAWRRSRHRSGGRFFHLTLGDLHANLHVMIEERVYTGSQEAFSSRKPLVVEGKVERRGESGEVTLLASRAWLLTADPDGDG